MGVLRNSLTSSSELPGPPEWNIFMDICGVSSNENILSAQLKGRLDSFELTVCLTAATLFERPEQLGRFLKPKLS